MKEYYVIIEVHELNYGGTSEELKAVFSDIPSMIAWYQDYKDDWRRDMMQFYKVTENDNFTMLNKNELILQYIF